MIGITLETLQNGNIRITGRVDGRTSDYRDGNASEAKTMCLTMLDRVAFAHKLADGSFDLTYIRLNDAAMKAIS